MNRRMMIAVCLLLCLLTAAVRAESAQDLYELGMALYDEGSYEEALALIEQAAGQGDADAQYRLGEMYHIGRGVSTDYRKAFEWFLKAADQGSVQALNGLGALYRNGLGVDKDVQKAFSLFEQAASQGLAAAEYNLGVMYRDGVGVEKDDVKAVEWLQKYASQVFEDEQKADVWLAKNAPWLEDEETAAEPAENDLLCNIGTEEQPRTRRLGTLGDIEGYTVARDEAMADDPNIPVQSCTPTGEGSRITGAYVLTGTGTYDQLSVSAKDSLYSYLPDFESSELEDDEFGGVKAKKFTFGYSMSDPNTEPGEEPTVIYVRGAYIYMDAAYDHCILVQVTSQNEDTEQLAAEEELLAEAEKIASAVTVG